MSTYFIKKEAGVTDRLMAAYESHDKGVIAHALGTSKLYTFPAVEKTVEKAIDSNKENYKRLPAPYAGEQTALLSDWLIDWTATCLLPYVVNNDRCFNYIMSLIILPQKYPRDWMYGNNGYIGLKDILESLMPKYPMYDRNGNEMIDPKTGEVMMRRDYVSNFWTAEEVQERKEANEFIENL